MKKNTALLIFLLCFFLSSASIGLSLAQETTKDSGEIPELPEKKLVVPKDPPATGINLTVSPVFINLSTEPGESVKSQISVTNNNNFTEYITLEIYKYEVNQNGQGLKLMPAEKNDEFIKWISFNQKEFSIAANEKKTVPFTITPPKSAALGYYYAIAVKRINEVKGENQPAVASVPGIPIILDVKSPNASRELQLLDFKTTSLFYEYLPTDFTIKVKNPGNIHIVPIGNIFIDSGNEKDIAILSANPGRNNVLPNMETELQTRWDDGFAIRVPKADDKGNIQYDSKGRMKYTTKWDLTKANKFRIGKYNAHLLLVYDNGERDVPLEAKVSFWIIPWKILGTIAIVLILVLMGLKSIIGASFKKVRRS